MEFIYGFLGGIMSSWYFLIAAVLFGVFFEHYEVHGFAVFWGILVALSVHFMFDIPFSELAVWSIAYFVIGVFWSFWRYRQYVISRKSRGRDLEYLEPSRHTDKIVSWIIIWPFSAVENIASDLIDMISHFVTNTLKNVYQRIYDNAISAGK